MEPFPKVAAFTWPAPDAQGNITLVPDEQRKILVLLRTIRIYLTTQYERCGLPLTTTPLDGHRHAERTKPEEPTDAATP